MRLIDVVTAWGGANRFNINPIIIIQKTKVKKPSLLGLKTPWTKSN